jgi:hypothetical protein
MKYTDSIKATIVLACPEGKEVILPFNWKNAKPYNCSSKNIFGRYLPKMNLVISTNTPDNEMDKNTNKALFDHISLFLMNLKNIKITAEQIR